MDVLIDDPIVSVTEREERRLATDPRDTDPVELFVRGLSRFAGYAMLVAIFAVLLFVILR